MEDIFKIDECIKYTLKIVSENKDPEKSNYLVSKVVILTPD